MFLRKLFDKSGLSIGCHHWSSTRLQSQVYSFMQFLQLPDVFMDTATLCSLTIILFPTLVIKKTKSRQYFAELDHELPSIRLAFYDVFIVNNAERREAFFSSPLIQYLWKLMLALKPDIVIHHLRRTRSYPHDGEARYVTLIADIQDLETCSNSNLLPDGALDNLSI